MRHDATACQQIAIGDNILRICNPSSSISGRSGLLFRTGRTSTTRRAPVGEENPDGNVNSYSHLSVFWLDQQAWRICCHTWGASLSQVIWSTSLDDRGTFALCHRHMYHMESRKRDAPGFAGALRSCEIDQARALAGCLQCKRARYDIYVPKAAAEAHCEIKLLADIQIRWVLYASLSLRRDTLEIPARWISHAFFALFSARSYAGLGPAMDLAILFLSFTTAAALTSAAAESTGGAYKARWLICKSWLWQKLCSDRKTLTESFSSCSGTFSRRLQASPIPLTCSYAAAGKSITCQTTANLYCCGKFTTGTSCINLNESGATCVGDYPTASCCAPISSGSFQRGAYLSCWVAYHCTAPITSKSYCVLIIVL